MNTPKSAPQARKKTGKRGFWSKFNFEFPIPKIPAFIIFCPDLVRTQLQKSNLVDLIPTLINKMLPVDHSDSLQLDYFYASSVISVIG